MVVEVVSNTGFRNIAANSLQGLKLFPDSVFYGINGSGKSTVCQLLAAAEECQLRTVEGEEISEVFAFNQQWMEATVGEFVLGGSAKGVTTVMLGDDAKALEKSIHEAEQDLKDQDIEIVEKDKAHSAANKRLASIKDNVFDGVRKSLSSECAGLSGKAFNRSAIEKVLEKDALKVLSDNDLEQTLQIATAEEPGRLSPLPRAPYLWSPEPEVWKELRTAADSPAQASLVITDWVKTGLEKHAAGDFCEFCTGEVTEDRLEELRTAIKEAEKNLSTVIADSLTQCQQAIDSITEFKAVLSKAIFESVQFGEQLDSKRGQLVIQLEALNQSYQEIRTLLENRKRDPQYHYSGAEILPEVSQTQDFIDELSLLYGQAETAIREHATHKKKALNALRLHCCAVDGNQWSQAKVDLGKKKEELDAANKRRDNLDRKLDDLKKQISTTVETARFIDKNLRMILGDDTLRVEVGARGEGYRITRKSQEAKEMSEGEKKLIALLYFCAEFLSEEREEKLARSIVLFDDLGSELDESRLFAVDRFVSSFFIDKHRPLAIAYFTHSYSYFKVLLARLSRKLKAQERAKKTIPAKAAFYEIFKDISSDQEQTTTWASWDEEAMKLTSDYSLSFYLVLKNLEGFLEKKKISYGVGNFCRKILEGFTEFKSPGASEFGMRLDAICKENNLSISPALSRLVNHLSHSSLDQASGVLSRNEIQSGLIQTLSFIQQVDEDHFEKMLKKFYKKQKARQLAEEVANHSARVAS